MTFNKVFTLGALAVLTLSGAGTAQAQVYTTTSVSPIMMPTQCVILNSNFGHGSSDWSINGAVSSLQNFLVGQGYFNSYYLGTGRYGSITVRAVAQFQASHGVPATGYVGPLTRALIQQISCGTNPVPPIPPPVSALYLYGAYPSAGVVGSTVTLSGYGFTGANTVLMDGSVAASNVPISSAAAIDCKLNSGCQSGVTQTLTFTIPTALAPYCAPGFACAQYMRMVTPGTYKLSVMNSNGTSNTVSFTVTDQSTNQQLSITGLDAPASLPIGTTGTWTVRALSNGQGTLHYSVVWGDETSYAADGKNIMAPQNTSTQSSATFNHSYARSGNYTPVFTVTDDYGHTVRTSNTVVVTPLY